MSVKCRSGYTLTGDTAVTCVDGTDFSFTNAPSCVLGLLFVVGILFTCIMQRDMDGGIEAIINQRNTTFESLKHSSVNLSQKFSESSVEDV